MYFCICNWQLTSCFCVEIVSMIMMRPQKEAHFTSSEYFCNFPFFRFKLYIYLFFFKQMNFLQTTFMVLVLCLNRAKYNKSATESSTARGELCTTMPMSMLKLSPTFYFFMLGVLENFTKMSITTYSFT